MFYGFSILMNESFALQKATLSCNFTLFLVSWLTAVNVVWFFRSDFVQENTCLINGKCYDDGEFNPENPSERCNASRSATASNETGQTLDVWCISTLRLNELDFTQGLPNWVIKILLLIF